MSTELLKFYAELLIPSNLMKRKKNMHVCKELIMMLCLDSLSRTQSSFCCQTQLLLSWYNGMFLNRATQNLSATCYSCSLLLVHQLLASLMLHGN
jgi:hypothetical protein